MSTPNTPKLCGLAAVLLAVALTACTPAPLYKPASNAVQAMPAQVAEFPERYQGASVIWGGEVVRVRNFSDHSEIEMLAYPLDSAQRPVLGKDRGTGRFIAMLPGYVEPLNYPPGSPVTVRGQIDGVRSGAVGNAPYVFPLVTVQQHHLWTAEEMRKGHTHVSFGMGVGFGSGGASGGAIGVGVH